MNIRIALPALFLFFIGCGSETVTPEKKPDSKPERVTPAAGNDRATSFRHFLNKFSVASLPLEIKTLNQDWGLETLPVLSKEDSLFISDPDLQEGSNRIRAWRLLPDTADSYKVIWLSSSEIFVPVLTTYSKSGKKISEASLTIGQCGADECFDCNETIRIGRDMSVYSVDSIQYSECDSLGYPVRVLEKYILYKTGQVLSSGKITMSEDRKAALAIEQKR